MTSSFTISDPHSRGSFSPVSPRGRFPTNVPNATEQSGQRTNTHGSDILLDMNLERDAPYTLWGQQADPHQGRQDPQNVPGESPYPVQSPEVAGNEEETTPSDTHLPPPQTTTCPQPYPQPSNTEASPPWSPAAGPSDPTAHKRRISDQTGLSSEHPPDRTYKDKMQDDLDLLGSANRNIDEEREHVHGKRKRRTVERGKRKDSSSSKSSGGKERSGTGKGNGRSGRREDGPGMAQTARSFRRRG